MTEADGGTCLFVLCDPTPDRPGGRSHDEVHRTDGSASGRLDQANDLGQHNLVALR